MDDKSDTNMYYACLYAISERGRGVRLVVENERIIFVSKDEILRFLEDKARKSAPEPDLA